MKTFGVRYAVVFNKEDLKLERVKEELSKYGDIFDESDDELIDDDGNKTPVKIIYIECTLSGGLSLIRDFNCVSATDNHYVLFPMASFEEKQKVLEAR